MGWAGDAIMAPLYGPINSIIKRLLDYNASSTGSRAPDEPSIHGVEATVVDARARGVAHPPRKARRGLIGSPHIFLFLLFHRRVEMRIVVTGHEKVIVRPGVPAELVGNDMIYRDFLWIVIPKAPEPFRNLVWIIFQPLLNMIRLHASARRPQRNAAGPFPPPRRRS